MPDVDEYVPDPHVAKEFHRSLMSVWRWDRDPRKAELGWPAKIRIGNRNYRSRKQLEVFKANLLRLALAERKGAAA
jgi:hypothetical protein